MYCKECGRQIADNSKFCRYCGTKQDHDISTVVETKLDEPKDINVNISFGKKVKTDTVKTEPVIPTNKYDESYEQEIGATIVGVIVIVVNLFVLFTRSYSGQSSSNEFYPIFSIINLLWRIIVTVWVVNIADRQNRSTGGWGVFSFFIPNLALIIIGVLKKLKGDNVIVEDSIRIDSEIEDGNVKNINDFRNPITELNRENIDVGNENANEEVDIPYPTFIYVLLILGAIVLVVIIGTVMLSLTNT